MTLMQLSETKLELTAVTEQRDSIEGMYHKVIAAALECDPIPACQREDDQLELPWEVITRIREQRDRLAEECAKIRDVAERAIDYLDQSYRDGFSTEVSELRYELAAVKGGSDES